MKTKCGYIAIIGRPNVGKSTLLNKILGEKVSIVARKAQTTRYRILGIKTYADAQMIYIDTPGLYQVRKKSKEHLLNRRMLKAASSAISEVDIIIFVIDVNAWRDDDNWILKMLSGVKRPVILALNKVDRVKQKTNVLSSLKHLEQKMHFSALIPISAKNGTNIKPLEDAVLKLLPENDFLYPVDQLSDKDDRFLASEVIREKLMRLLGEELPYAINVEIEKFSQEKGILNIDALIWVEKESQKAIVIGKGGQKLKAVGSLARKELEHLLEIKVFLKLWVKVKRNWSDDERALNYVKI